MSRETLANSQTNGNTSQMSSAAQSRQVQSSEKVECSAISSNAHPYVTPNFSTGARSLFSASSNIATEVPTLLLHHPSSLGIYLQRTLTFNHRRNIVTAADAEKNLAALMLMLNKCHNVCTRFVLVGFVLAVMGVVAFVWGRLEQDIAIFGSVCVGVCLVFGFGAVH
ncbi:hypothetical protein EI94DRAFT_1722909 [Lactarius quietus]|nr:hypothetical protein EI94DRAFT_1722909 [Lactarius quietus]